MTGTVFYHEFFLRAADSKSIIIERSKRMRRYFPRITRLVRNFSLNNPTQHTKSVDKNKGLTQIKIRRIIYTNKRKSICRLTLLDT